MSARIPLKAYFALPVLLTVFVVSILAFYDSDPLLLRPSDMHRAPTGYPDILEAKHATT